jgi:hypothetical protein
MRTESIDKDQQNGHRDLATQIINAPDILESLDEFLHWEIFCPLCMNGVGH